MAQTSAKHLERADRRAQVVSLRRDQKLSLREIAKRVGCSCETARRDINRYLSAIDEACLENAAALRAEEYVRLETYATSLDRAIGDGDLSLVAQAVKVSESTRKLYALDVQPLGRSEMALRRAVITEIASKLRDQLPPETFAQIALLLTEDEPIALIGDVATASANDAPPVAITAGE